MNQFVISPKTRSHYRPSADFLNVSMDFNAAPSGKARGTEVIIPDNASPEVRRAAELFNQGVADFAAKHGITDYPVRGIRTRSENGRGVPHTIHAEPFFNTDTAMQQAISSNPGEFSEIYRRAFGNLSSARLIAPHGVGKDRGAASDVFGSETDFGQMVANTLLGNPIQMASSGQQTATGGQGGDTMQNPQAPQAAQQAPQKPAFWDRFMGGALADPDKRARLAVALEGATLNPNQAMMQAAQQRIADRRETKQTRKQQNRTIEALRQAGVPDKDLQIAMSNPEYMRALLSQVAQSRMGGGSEQTAAAQNWDTYSRILQEQGPEAAEQFLKFSGGQNINVNTSPQGMQLPDPPKDTLWARGADGEVVMEDVDLGDGRTVQRPVAVPIAGSQTDTETQNRGATRGRVGGTALDEMDYLLKGLGYDSETGEVGEALISAPRTRAAIGSGENQTRAARILAGGTDTLDWLNTMQSLQDTIAIDRLLEIKAAGSGLGQVPQSQLRSLARAMGNLNVESSNELLINNLLRAQSIYNDVVNKSLQDVNDPTFRGLIRDVAPGADAFSGDNPANGGGTGAGGLSPAAESFLEGSNG